MSRDWLLTMLVLSPVFLGATVVLLGLIWQPIQNERARRAARTGAPLQRADPMSEPRPTPLDVVAR
jgi:hypothetical protein